MRQHQFKFIVAIGVLASVSAVTITGCGGGRTPSPNPVSETAAVLDSNVKKESKTPATVDTKVAPPKIEEDSAAAAVLRTLRALEAGNLGEAYDFLPPSYQADIDGLLHEFADRFDPEIWSRLHATARKLVQVLRAKKEMIFALDLFRDRPEAEPYRKQWDPTLEVMKSLLDSDVVDLAKLKQITARTLLTGKATPSISQLDALGQAVGADLSKQFAGVTVTPIQSSGAEQTIALRGPKDEKPTEIVYVKHDGHWLPKSMIEAWKRGIADDRAWLQKFPERIQSVKQPLLEGLFQADDILDQLLAATNREQFEKAAGQAILTLAVEWPKLQRMAMQTVVSTNESSSVTITINRELTETEQSKLLAAVLKPLTQSGSDYTLLSNDGRTHCRLLRVNDVTALLTSLATHYNLPESALSYDRQRSTIQFDLAP